MEEIMEYYNYCEQCKKCGEPTCGDDPECKCFEPMNDDSEDRQDVHTNKKSTKLINGGDNRMEKMFCKKCRYFVGGRLVSCEYPDNITTKYDWRSEWKSHIREPRKINKYNCCRWFEKR